jgi:kinetochore protein Nuf2
MQKAARNIYTVPDLPVKEIIEYFGDMEIEMKTSDICKPTLQTTVKLYEMLLEVYCGIKTSDMLAKAEALEGGQVFEGALSFMLLQKRMASFLRRLGINNFGLKDLSPDSKRLVGILSVVVNFSMFRDNKRQTYERMCQANDEKLMLKNEVDEKIYNARRELEKCERSAKKNLEDVKAIEREIAGLEAELKELYRHQRTLVQETEKLKRERTELSDRLSSSRLLVLNLGQEITCLKTQVVSDPTKLMELLEEMRCLILREKESLRMLEGMRNGHKEAVENVCGMKEEAERCIALAVSSREAEKTVEKINKEIAATESKAKSCDSSMNATKIRLGHVARQISHIESKMFNLQDNDKRCSEEISAKLKNLKSSYGAVSDERSAIQHKIEENGSLTKSIEYETVRRRSEHSGDVTAIQSMLCKIKDDIFNYFAESKGLVERADS